MARLFHEGGAAALILLLAAAGPAGAQAQNDAVQHLGVRACSGSTCHGAVEPFKNSYVPQNEYLIWAGKTDKGIDKHRLAYDVLKKERAVQIAHNLGLPDAVSAPICLHCHTDYAPKDAQGPGYDISDGVGCEACHGPAEKWIGVHLSGASHQANLEAGLYPTDQPVARAEKCLSCHFGNSNDQNQFVTHLIMGAGHPRMPFELDTFTAAEPAHFTVDEAYVKRKGPVNDVQVWAVGQEVNLVKRMDALLDPTHAPKGVQPELVLFDCAACHHPITELRWHRRSSTGLPPGAVKLDDANAVMLRVIAARVAPAAAKALAQHILALHRATTEDWKTVVREAAEVRGAAKELQDALSSHDFTRDDMKALAEGVIAVGLSGDDTDFPGAEQATMALGSIASAMKMSGALNPEQTKSVKNALDGLYKSISDAATYRPDAFVLALKDFQKAIPQ